MSRAEILRGGAGALVPTGAGELVVATGLVPEAHVIERRREKVILRVVRGVAASDDVVIDDSVWEVFHQCRGVYACAGANDAIVIVWGDVVAIDKAGVRIADCP